MADALIEKLRSLSDSQLLKVIASRDLVTSLRYKLCVETTPEVEYSSEQLIVEIVGDALNGAISDGLSQSDVIVFYHVMVEALDCCGQFRYFALKC